MDAFQVGVLPHFAAGLAVWSPAKAWYLAECSRLVYRPGAAGAVEIRQALAGIGLTRVEFFGWGGKGTQAFLAWGDRFAVLAFRGTEPGRDPKDIVTDLKANLVPVYGGGKVHAGFLGAFNEIEDVLVDVLVRGSLRVPLYVTGHSLGGALAVIAGQWLQGWLQGVRWGAPAAIYTFGAPRVGDSDFVASMIRIPQYRMVRCADIVPRRPWILTLAGYLHGGDLRYIDRDGKIWVSPPPRFRWWDRTVARARAAKEGRLLRIVADHHFIEPIPGILRKVVDHGY